jgi:hypothetical protein
MPDESRPLDKRQLLELDPDFLYESHYEFVARLAHKLWVQRGALSVRRTASWEDTGTGSASMGDPTWYGCAYHA